MATPKRKPAVKKAGGKAIKLDSKSRKKRTVKAAASKPRELKPLHKKLINLFVRPQGATMHDTYNAGWEYPAMAALKIAERHGYKVTAKKVPGELTRYTAKR